MWKISKAPRHAPQQKRDDKQDPYWPIETTITQTNRPLLYMLSYSMKGKNLKAWVNLILKHDHKREMAVERKK